MNVQDCRDWITMGLVGCTNYGLRPPCFGDMYSMPRAIGTHYVLAGPSVVSN